MHKVFGTWVFNKMTALKTDKYVSTLKKGPVRKNSLFFLTLIFAALLSCAFPLSSIQLLATAKKEGRIRQGIPQVYSKDEGRTDLHYVWESKQKHMIQRNCLQSLYSGKQYRLKVQKQPLHLILTTVDICSLVIIQFSYKRES